MKIFSLIYFLIISAFITSGCSKKQEGIPPVEVTAFQVQPQTIPADFEFVGVGKSSHPVEIQSRVEGYLMSIDYVEGKMVEPGDLLFRIDPRQFEASLQESKGELARQEAILWRAKRSLSRIEPLFEKNAASQRDLDDATAQVLAAEAQVIEAKANVWKAELNLGYTYITSPIQGLSGRAIYREGTLITPGINGLLTTISVIDPIWVYFSISDDQLLQGRAEQETLILLPEENDYCVSLILADGTQFPYVGRVNFSSPTLDPQTGTMMVRAEFPNPDGTLLPGQFVQAIVSGAFRPNAIFVPQQSVSQGRNGMYVFLIDSENKVSMRNVQVGEWYQNYWIITQGLEKGDLVVADGVNKVQEGVTVKIISSPQKTGSKQESS